MKNELEVIEKREVSTVARGGDLEMIMSAATDPRCDVDKMKALLAMAKEIREEQRKDAYASDLVALQAVLPQIQKSGKIIVKEKLRSTYALSEDIDTAIRPLLATYGFSFTFDSESKDGKMFLLTCKMIHRLGHSETKTLLLPIDSSDFRSQIQSVNSTITNGKRILRAMHLNLIEKGKDDDGQGGDKRITEDQERDLQVLIEEVKQDVPRFLKHFGIDKISDLPAKELEGALRDLERKRK